MKPEQYLKKLREKVESDINKNIQRLEDKKNYYRYEKYPEDFYGCKYDIYWDKCDAEIEEWNRLRDTFDGCRVSIPEKKQIWKKANFCLNRIDKFDSEGYIQDDYTGFLLRDIVKNMKEIIELTHKI